MSGIEHALIGDWHLAAFAALKALALFVTAGTAFRFTQRRTLADFTPFDWVTAVAVGAIIGRTATAWDTSVFVGAAALRQHGHLTPAGVGLALSEQNGSVTVVTTAALADAQRRNDADEPPCDDS